MKKLILFLFSCFCLTWQVQAQQSITVTGTVTDKTSGEALIGVSVQVKGANKGTVTDIDGHYSISITENGKLAFSYLGMTEHEVQVNGKTLIDVQMTPDSQMLDEVVAIGFGTAKKRDLTGSIVSVRGDDIKSTPSQSALSGLQGKVPGLSVTNAGPAGSAPQIRLRGVGSMKDANPKYLVDGILIDNIDFLNPTDIASVEVLKDASSLAMFGIQGANGIIIITTKKAEQGKTKVNFDAYTGFQKIMNSDKVSLTNGDGFTMLLNERLMNEALDRADPEKPYIQWYPQIEGPGTNWVDEVTRTAPISSVSMNVSSASDKNNAFFSLSYFTQDGVVKDDNYQRITARFNDDFKIFKWWKLGGSAALSYAYQNITNNSYDGILQNAVWSMPTYKPYNDDGTYMMPDRNIQSNIGNPVAKMNIGAHDNHLKYYRMVGNLYTEFTILDKLTFRSAGYVDARINQGKKYQEQYELDGSQRSLSSSLNRNMSEAIIAQTENYLTYENTFNKDHHLKVMGGFTTAYRGNENFNASRDTIGTEPRVDERYQMLLWGSRSTMDNNDGKSEIAQVSAIARLNYEFQRKYILSATFRADASSKFSTTNQWGYFPSVGLAWNISEENFMESTKTWLDFLKLKGSWGIQGNDNPIGAYEQYDYAGRNNYAVFGTGLTQYYVLPATYVASDLRWEKMIGTDIGVEAVMLNHRLNTEIGVFKRTASDFLIYPQKVPGVKTYSPINGGSMVNKGIEFSINWQDKIGEVKYSIGGNFSYINNEVTDIPENAPSLTVSDSRDILCRTVEGETIAHYFGYKVNGIFQNQEEIDAHVFTDENGVTKLIQPDAKPGDFRIEDVHGDGTIDDLDRINLGSYFAPFSYGFNMGAEYKGFDLTFDFAGVAGNKIYNATKYPGGDTARNFQEGWMGRWHGEGTSDTYPILSLQGKRSENYRTSDFFLENGSYLRLRNIQLGYKLPQNAISKIKLTGCRFYVNAQNLFTITSYSGWTPELKVNDPLKQGVDDGTVYPLPSTVTFGVNLSF